jgi:hypothetical protein
MLLQKTRLLCCHCLTLGSAHSYPHGPSALIPTYQHVVVPEAWRNRLAHVIGKACTLRPPPRNCARTLAGHLRSIQASPAVYAVGAA